MNYLLKMKFKHFLIGVLIISASMVLMFFTWFYVLEDDLMDESEVEITEKVLVSRNQTEAGVPQEVETSDSEDEIERFGLVNNFTELDGNLTYVPEIAVLIFLIGKFLCNTL